MTPLTTQIPLTTITFPEIALRVRDAHKLRGYFGGLFREHSPLLHNHFEEIGDGTGPKYRYAYPLVQYKVLRKVPTLVGLGEGGGIAGGVVSENEGIADRRPNLPRPQQAHSSIEQATVGLSDDLHTYRYESLWLGLNQKNFRKLYQEAAPDQEKSES